jgi:hypothetical protein
MSIRSTASIAAKGLLGAAALAAITGTAVFDL